MSYPIAVEGRVSAELREVMEELANDPDREEAPTLEDVRAYLEISGQGDPSDELHPLERTSIALEIDELIDEYGEYALAIDFIAATASEDLSRIIEAAMEDPELPDNPSLADVRQAMVGGLTARLIGDGVIEIDDEQTLLAEIDGYIDDYGEDVLAETLIRYE